MSKAVFIFLFAALCTVALAYPSLPARFEMMDGRHVFVYPGQYPDELYIIEYPDESVNWEDSPYYQDVDLDDGYEQNEAETVDEKTIESAEDDVTEGNEPESSATSSESDESNDALVPHRRSRRQAAQAALDLASSHTDSDGNPRGVLQPHGYADAHVSGTDNNNFNGNARAGVGSVLWRSRNDRHTVGVGAAVDHNFGRFRGIRMFPSRRPNVGVGISYRWRF